MNLRNSVERMDETDCFIAYLQAGLLPAQIQTDEDGDPVYIYDAPVPGTPEFEVLRQVAL